MTEATASDTPRATDAAVAAPAPRWKRVLRHPLTRFALFVLLLLALNRLVSLILPPTGLSMREVLAKGGLPLLQGAVRSIVPSMLAYWLLVRLVEGRKVDEFSPRKLLPHLGGGWLLGMGLMVAAAALMAVFGAYRITGMNEGVNLLASLVVLGILPGVTEEIVFRGILYRLVEERLGSWIALVFSGLLFGGVHIMNPNASVWSSTAIAIEAGLLLGLCYAATRSLWFVIGVHAAWNFTQGAVLGIAVSGIETKGLLIASTPGHWLISGGEFGAEGSLLTVLLSLALSAYFLRRTRNTGRLRPPFWRRAGVATPSS